MEQSKIDRINEFARRVKNGETLTPEELAERDALRQEYIESYRRSLRNTLDNTVIQYPDGSRQKVKPKE